MLTPCQSLLQEARDLLEHGIFGEGVGGLVRLRRCAHNGACREWQDCQARIEVIWSDRPGAGRPEFPAARCTHH